MKEPKADWIAQPRVNLCQAASMLIHNHKKFIFRLRKTFMLDIKTFSPEFINIIKDFT